MDHRLDGMSLTPSWFIPLDGARRLFLRSWKHMSTSPEFQYLTLGPPIYRYPDGGFSRDRLTQPLP